MSTTIVEESYVDLKNKTFTTYTRNIGMNSIMVRTIDVFTHTVVKVSNGRRSFRPRLKKKPIIKFDDQLVDDGTVTFEPRPKRPSGA